MKNTCELCNGKYIRTNDNYVYDICKDEFNIYYYPIKEVIANKVIVLKLNFCPICGKELKHLEREE